MAVLSAQDVSFSYQGKYETVYAVSEFNYDFERGKFYAIMGKSGSGKTTLLSLLAGLETPAKGDVFFKETPVRELNNALYRRDSVAVIYQSFNLFPLLTAEENVMYPLLLRKTDKKQSREIAHTKLAEVGLDGALYKRRPGQLSGGEQQRVAIARALAAGGEIILADEPTGNLDETNMSHIVQLLRSIAHDRDRCVITVTHDPSIAEQADHVLHLSDGRLIDL